MLTYTSHFIFQIQFVQCNFLFCLLEKTNVAIQDDTRQIVQRDFMFTLANLYIGGLLLEHLIHDPHYVNDVDVLVLKQWIAQRDIVPVVTKSRNGAYDVSKDNLSDIVFEGYNPNLTVEGEYIR